MKWFYIMLTSLILWTTFFLGPFYLGATDYTILAFSISGFVGILIHLINNKNNRLLISLVSLLYICAIYLTLSNNTLSYRHLVGFIFAILSGISVFNYVRFSSHLQNQLALSTSAMLVLRWWLATITIFILCIPKLHLLISTPPIMYLQMLVPTFFGIIIPSYLLLISAVKAGPIISTILTSITPFFTLLFSVFILHSKFSFLEIVASVLITIAVILYQLISQKRKYLK